MPEYGLCQSFRRDKNILNAEIQANSTTVARESNKVVTKEVTFPKPFSKTPQVFVNPCTKWVEGMTCAATNMTAEGFTIYCYSQVTDEMAVSWIAICK